MSILIEALHFVKESEPVSKNSGNSTSLWFLECTNFLVCLSKCMELDEMLGVQEPLQ